MTVNQYNTLTIKYVSDLYPFKLKYINNGIKIHYNEEVFFTRHIIKYKIFILLFTSCKMFLIENYKNFSSGEEDKVEVSLKHVLGVIHYDENIFYRVKDYKGVPFSFFSFIEYKGLEQLFLKWLSEPSKTLLCNIYQEHFGHLLRDNLLHLLHHIEHFSIKFIGIKKPCLKFCTLNHLKDIVPNDVSISVLNNERKLLTFLFKNHCFCLPGSFYLFKRNNHDSILTTRLRDKYLLTNNEKTTRGKSMLLVSKFNERSPTNQLEMFIALINIMKPYINTFIIQGHITLLDQPTYFDKYTNNLFRELKHSVPDVDLINLCEVNIIEYANFIKNIKIYFSPLGSMQHVVDAFAPKDCIKICHGIFTHHTNGQVYGYEDIYVLPDSCIQFVNKKCYKFNVTPVIKNVTSYIKPRLNILD